MFDKPIKILLFEDNLGDARLFAETIKEIPSQRYEIIHVNSLSEGLTALGNKTADIILLDLGLPDSQHLDTLIKLRSQVLGVPIVILTGNDDEENALRAVQQGAQDYLVKQKINADVLSRVICYSIERQKLQDELRSLALIDDLTGLYNRRGFFTLAEHYLKLAERMHKKFYLIFSDIDNLKKINDDFGHLQGDLFLKKAAEILRYSFRDSDIIARIGGDEFVVLIPETTDYNAKSAITRLQENIKKYNKKEKKNLSLSMGIANFHPNLKFSLQDLLDKADKHLYEEKKKRHLKNKPAKSKILIKKILL
ncbi:MAG: GGDEF domain-containing response regulator [Bacteroidetes bacterium]|nr:GGDEF domain-containing response regulator [Bacteroidota bacterium]